MDVNSVKPSNVIIKYDMPKDPSIEGSGGARVFELKAVNGGRFYGTQLTDITQSLRSEKPFGVLPEFQIIG